MIQEGFSEAIVKPGDTTANVGLVGWSFVPTTDVG